MTESSSSDPLAERHYEPPEPTVSIDPSVGDRVRVTTLPQYVKTADPMPMLRPPDVIQLGEVGTIVDRRPGNYWVVRFANGIFLLEARYFTPVAATDAGPSA